MYMVGVDSNYIVFFRCLHLCSQKREIMQSERTILSFSQQRPEKEVRTETVAMGMNTGMLTAIAAISVLVIGLMIAAVVLQGRVAKKEKELRTKNLRCRNPRY